VRAPYPRVTGAAMARLVRTLRRVPPRRIAETPPRRTRPDATAESGPETYAFRQPRASSSKRGTPAAASPRDSAMLPRSPSFSLLNQIIDFGLVLGLAARPRRVFHHARGLGLPHTIARVGFYGLRCRKPSWLAFRHSASPPASLCSASCVSRWQRRVYAVGRTLRGLGWQTPEAFALAFVLPVPGRWGSGVWTAWGLMRSTVFIGLVYLWFLPGGAGRRAVRGLAVRAPGARRRS
jgi:hypothetical protein